VFTTLVDEVKAQSTTSNLATQATASASTTDNNGLFNWNLINDGNISACGSGQEAFIWGDPGQNNMSMQWEWSKQVRTDEMVFHHEQGDRTLTGFTLQSWDGSQWVDEKQFSSITSSPGVCTTSITFQTIRTNKIRLIKFKMTDPGQKSNPNFREIEIREAPPAVAPTASFFLPDTIYANQQRCITNESRLDTGNVWYIDGQRQTTDDVLKYRPGSANTSQTVSLAVTNAQGSDSVSQSVYIAQPSAPVARFNASSNIIDPQDAVEFTDLSTGGPNNWQWSFDGPRFNSTFIDPSIATTTSCFGGSNSDTTSDPVVQFLFPGRYDAQQIVSNSLGTDTLDKPDYVIVREVINDICAEGSSDFGYGRIYDDGGEGNEYSNNTNCQFTINTCRQVVLKLREFDLEPGDFLRIYDGKSSNGVPLWDTAQYGMDGLTGDQSNVPSQITAKSGKVYLEFVTDNSGTGDGFNITWLSQPKQFSAPSASVGGPDTVCPGEAVSFTNTAQNYYAEYNWDTTGLNNTGDAGSGEELEITFPYAGTWNLDLEAANCGDTVTTTKTVVVETPSGPPSAAFSADNRTPVIGQPVQFTDSASLCASYYEWQFDGPVSFEEGTRNSASPKVAFSQSGCYEVTLSVGNSADTATVIKQCYIDVRCQPAIANLSSDIGIGRFQFSSDIDNESSIGEQGFTSYFQDERAQAELGGTYQLTVSRNTSFNDQRVKVWLDVDGDNNFDEASELVGSQGQVGQQYSTTLTIPDTTELGAVRLRVGAGLSGQSLEPCGVTTYGEYEDYGLEVTPDQTAPEIVLQGADTVSLAACGQLSVVDTGTYAIDEIQGRINQVQRTVQVDASTPGLDSIRYEATDSSGNTAVRYRYVQVGRDQTAPQASLQGADTVTTPVLNAYTDPGLAGQQDTCSGIAEVSTDDQVNTDELGIYPYTYTVADSAGNATQLTRYVEVRDTTAPTFTLQGDDPLEVELDSDYREPGISNLTDNYWGGDNLSLNIDNPVLTGGVDTFTVTYTVTDGSGNTTTKERTVVIEDRTAPEVSLPQGLSAGDTVAVQAGVEADIASRVSVSDNSRSKVTLDRSGSYFSILDDQGRPAALGVYEGTWTFSDGSGNTATLDLVVEVIDTRAPELSLKGQRTTNIERWERSRYEDFDTAVTVSDNHVIAEKRVDTQASYFSEYVADSFVTGYYELRYEAVDSAGNTSSIKRFIRVNENITGLTDDQPAAELQLYPNPTEGQLTVNIDGTIEEGRMQVLNSRGQVVRNVTGTAQQLEGTYRVGLSGEPAGMYFLQITTPETTTNKQFIIAE
jgi:PKD repeat protein